jgi:hypothetical protein
MPCGEDVVGHVMEHIDGVTMERFIQDQGPAALTLEDSLEQAVSVKMPSLTQNIGH